MKDNSRRKIYRKKEKTKAFVEPWTDWHQRERNIDLKTFAVTLAWQLRQFLLQMTSCRPRCTSRCRWKTRHYVERHVAGGWSWESLRDNWENLGVKISVTSTSIGLNRRILAARSNTGLYQANQLCIWLWTTLFTSFKRYLVVKCTAKSCVVLFVCMPISKPVSNSAQQASVPPQIKYLHDERGIDCRVNYL